MYRYGTEISFSFLIKRHLIFVWCEDTEIIGHLGRNSGFAAINLRTVEFVSTFFFI